MADANFQDIAPLTFAAGATIAINRFVKQDTTADRQVIQGSAGTSLIIGVSLEAGSTTITPIAVQTNGIAKVTAGAAVARGALVASDATGRAVTAATGDTTAGLALMAAGAAGDVIEVLLNGINSNGPTTP